MKYQIYKCNCGNVVEEAETWCEECDLFDSVEAFYSDKMMDELILEDEETEAALDNMSDIHIRLNYK